VKRAAAVVLLALAAACGDRAPAEGTIRATVTRPQVAPVALAVPARAHPCAGGNGQVITGTADLQGMLVWLVPGGGPDTGAFTVNRGADSVPGRHARVSLRYLAGDVAHSLALDSGTVRVGRDGDVLSGSVGGTGFDGAENARPLVDAVFQGIRVLPDSEPCGAAGA
jgi:hypothetical protein